MTKKIEIDKILTFLLYEYLSKCKIAKAVQNICRKIGDAAILYDTAKVWFAKFKKGDFNLDEKEHSGLELDKSRLLELVEKDLRRLLHELEKLLKHDHSTIARHLHRLGKASKLGVWIPHELSTV